MKESTGDYSLSDILIVLKAFFRYQINRFWLLFLVALIGGGLGVYYYFKQKPRYEATTTFILEDKSTAGGGLAGLASQFGINVGSLNGGGSFFAGDNILNILKSKKVVQEVLLSQVQESSLGNQTLADLYLEFTGIKEAWQKKPLLARISFADVKKEISPVRDSVLNAIYEKIINSYLSTDRASKQGSIIKVQVIASNSLFARLMTERLVEAAAKLYVDIKTGTAEANIQQLQRRSDSLLVALNRKSFSAAASQPLDINPAIRTAIVPSEIATRDKTVLATLYAEVTKNLEASKLILSQQSPVIQVLDRPEYLLVDKKKGMKFCIAVFALGLFAVYLIGALLYFLRKGDGGKYRSLSFF
jgi:hypothetical protein